MPDASNSSFIPKHGPSSPRKHGTASRRVYLFTIVSYIVFFATLLAAGGMYLYTTFYVKEQLNKEVIELNNAIADFNETRMNEVLEFDERLRLATDRINNNVSVVSILQALEAATIDAVSLSNLSMERKSDESYKLTATVNTDSFDATIFQRGAYQRNQKISNVMISGVQYSVAEGGSETATVGDPQVTFTAILNVPVSKEVLYNPSAEPINFSVESYPQTEVAEPAETNSNSDETEIEGGDTVSPVTNETRI